VETDGNAEWLGSAPGGAPHGYRLHRLHRFKSLPRKTVCQHEGSLRPVAKSKTEGVKGGEGGGQ
jgi:hypothetical protein